MPASHGGWAGVVALATMQREAEEGPEPKASTTDTTVAQSHAVAAQRTRPSGIPPSSHSCSLVWLARVAGSGFTPLFSLSAPTGPGGTPRIQPCVPPGTDVVTASEDQFLWLCS